MYTRAIALGIVLGLAIIATDATIQHAVYRHHGPALLNDLNVTPGIVRTTDKNDPAVCGGGSTKAYRKPGIQAVYKIYGATKQKGVCCEIDHLISLELGGDNGIANEWPQPYEPRPGAHEKDEVENWLHAQVCAGKIPLAEAQKEISTDWYAVYLKMPQSQPQPAAFMFSSVLVHENIFCVMGTEGWLEKGTMCHSRPNERIAPW